MNVVVDASVAVKWFVEEGLHHEAMAVLDEAEELHAPDLLLAEVANISWKKTIRGEIEHTQAAALISALRDLFPTPHPFCDLVDRALEIAESLGHPVYGCIYIVCAECLNAPLITADQRLLAAARNSESEHMIRHLGDPGFRNRQ